MNKTKQGYVAPLSDLLVVRFEENIMSVKWGGNNQAATMEDEDDDRSFTF